MLNKALSLHQKGRLDEAASLYRKVLAQNPKNADALHLLGVIEYQRKNLPEAVALIDRAIALAPNDAVFFCNRGAALCDLKRFAEALDSHDRALAIKPDFPEALNNRGLALQALKRFDEALESYERCLAIKPDHVKAINNRGVTLGQLQRFDDALASYARALMLKPDYVDALSNRGNTLRDMKRFEDALASFDLALAIKADDAGALINRGGVLQELKRYDEALASYDRASAIEPNDVRFLGARLFCKMNICDWRGLGDDLPRLAEAMASGQKASEPFPALALSLSAPLLRACSEIHVRETHPPNLLLPKIKGSFGHDRIRIGYFSSDFRNHPVACVTAELFEGHDRSKFQVIAFSLAAAKRDAMRTRLEKGFDRFLDVGSMSDRTATSLARKLEIDIAIDLNGFTEGNRANIFAMRAAPVQVNYLGYAGTMGASYIDYLMADSTLVPEQDQKHYTEKIVYLPHTYMPSDTKRAIRGMDFSRTKCGLPENGFVFCCFNNAYKIGPELFDPWMRLLRKVEGSVLWLPQSSEVAMRNLRSEANARGVDPDRLVFAAFLAEPEDHLGRLKLADLFLDTLPYNAHSTASDALWSRLPILTCLGETFPGRVAASLLYAVGLPELVTKNLDEYEALALDLATNPAKLLSLRQKLAANRLTHPLFNAPLFTRHVEAAYLAMWKRHQAGLAPDHIRVPLESEAAPRSP